MPLLTKKHQDAIEIVRGLIAEIGSVPPSKARAREIAAVGRINLSLIEEGLLDIWFAPGFDEDGTPGDDIGLLVPTAVMSGENEMTLISPRFSEFQGSVAPFVAHAEAQADADDDELDDPDIDEEGVSSGDLGDSRQFIRVPVIAHAILKESWMYDGEKQRVFHTRRILGDDTYVDFSDPAFEHVDTVAPRSETFAVFGSSAAEIDLRREPYNLELLLAEKRIIPLGVQHPDVDNVDWGARLDAARERARIADESDGVEVNGKYHKLPELHLDARLDADPGSDEDPPQG